MEGKKGKGGPSAQTGRSGTITCTTWVIVAYTLCTLYTLEIVIQRCGTVSNHDKKYFQCEKPVPYHSYGNLADRLPVIRYLTKLTARIRSTDEFAPSNF